MVLSLTKKEALLLISFLILGFFLRTLFLKNGALTFGFDQARDAYAAKEIINGHLKILGPSASTPGLYHGVAYFYLIAPAYFLGNGDPIITAIWLSIVNLSTIVPIFLLGKLLFSPKVGLLASFLFAISFDSVQYATWMSNPAPALLTGAIFSLGSAMYFFSKEKTLGAILSAFGLGFSIQFEVFLSYLFIPLIISLMVFKIRPTIREVVIFGVVFLVSTSSMIVSYIKFGPTFLSGVGSLYSGGGDPFGAWRQFAPTLELYLNRFAEYFYRGLLPFNSTFAGLLGMLIIYFLIKWNKENRKFDKQLTLLLILLFSHGLLIPFGGVSTPFINAGLEATILTLVAFFLVSLWIKQKWTSLGLFLLIIFSCLWAIFKYDNQGQTVFAIQRGLILRNELSAIDYTYRSSNGEKFSVNTITSPLWINTVWAYLYNWYGQSHQRFLPSFHGRDQTGYPGSLSSVSGKDKFFYLIIEPLAGIPQRFATDTINFEDTFSKIIEEKDFAGIVVQKRVLTKPFDQIRFI